MESGIEKAIKMHKRTLVVGDIHGGYRALVQVLERTKLHVSDHLIFLGDYVDGWSQSQQVIDYLIQLNKTYSCIFIRGNHDVWCEEWLNSGTHNMQWLIHGGASTVESYEEVDTETKQAHLLFFNSMKNYHIDEHNNLFIHAGYASMHGPKNETYTSNYNWDRTLWELALAMDKSIPKNSKFYPKRLKLFREIYIGHTPTTNYDVEKPMNSVNVWNIDTGAGFKGKVSVIDIATKEFWQSDHLPTLYPGEKGRN